MHTITYQHYGLGKFPSNIEEWFYQQSMKGTEENEGCEWFGWYRLLLFSPGEVQIDYGDLDGVEPVAAAVVHEDDAGFVTVYTFRSHDKARRAYQRFVSLFPSKE